MSFLTKEQESQIQIFTQKLLEKNKQINLVSRKNPKKRVESLLKESLDAALFLKCFFQNRSQKILDIGSGNGFPGLLFAVCFPQQEFYLCERRRNKAEALKWISSQCRLLNTRILCETAENLKPDYCLILSQASQPPDKIKKLLKKLLKPESEALLWVSKNQARAFEAPFVVEKLQRSNPEKTILKLKLRESL